MAKKEDLLNTKEKEILGLDLVTLLLFFFDINGNIRLEELKTELAKLKANV